MKTYTSIFSGVIKGTTMERPDENGWVYTDPDNRPKVPDVPHCFRCKKPMKAGLNNANVIGWTSVEINDDDEAKINPLGKYLIGKDCWKIMLDQAHKAWLDSFVSFENQDQIKNEIIR